MRPTEAALRVVTPIPIPSPVDFDAQRGIQPVCERGSGEVRPPEVALRLTLGARSRIEGRDLSDPHPTRVWLGRLGQKVFHRRQDGSSGFAKPED